MKNPKHKIRIMFVGDINFGEYYMSFGHGPRSFIKNDDPFREVRNIINKADFLVGNLEAPLTNNNLIPGEPESLVLRGDPAASALLSDAGFRILQVANNHTVQHGVAGFDETINVLKSSGIAPVGLSNQAPQILEIKGQEIAFLAASDVPDNTDKNQSKYQKIDDNFLKRIESTVSQVDHLFVLLHWGLESSTAPLEYQIEYSKKLQALGVRGVIGHHPHLFYEIFKQDEMVFAPSLGNFIFDLAWDKRLVKSGILDISIEDGLISARVWPVELRENGCLPTPVGSATEITNKTKLYALGTSMSGEQTKKTIYLLKNLIKGSTSLKLKFLSRKIKNRIIRI